MVFVLNCGQGRPRAGFLGTRLYNHTGAAFRKASCLDLRFLSLEILTHLVFEIMFCK